MGISCKEVRPNSQVRNFLSASLSLPQIQKNVLFTFLNEVAALLRIPFWGLGGGWLTAIEAALKARGGDLIGFGEETDEDGDGSEGAAAILECKIFCLSRLQRM